MPDLMRGAERQTLFDDADNLVELGLPRELALRLAELLSAFLLLDVVEIAEATGYDPHGVAELHYAVSERLSIDELLTRVTALPRDDRWSTLARSAARHDVYAALSAITTAILRSTDDALGADQRIDAWVEQNSNASNGPARRCGPRSIATSPIWPPCRWRCGCCAVCPGERVQRWAMGTRAQTCLPPALRRTPQSEASAATMPRPRPPVSFSLVERCRGSAGLPSSTRTTTALGSTSHVTSRARPASAAVCNTALPTSSLATSTTSSMQSAATS